MSFRFLRINRSNWRFLGMLSATGDPRKSLSVFAFLSCRSFRLKIQRAISEEMTMFMALFARKGNMLVVYWLDPFIIIMK